MANTGERFPDQYTPEQVALVLMQGALGFEYYMQEQFRLYDVGPDDSRMLRPPEWVRHGERLNEWCQERSYALGLGVWEQEIFGDQLILHDFHPLAMRISSAPGLDGGKVAFLALTTALILKAFSEYVSGAGKELADEWRNEVEAYLWGTWGVDLVRGIAGTETASVHLPQAREAERRWRRRLQLLTQAPLRAPFTQDQVASLFAYRTAWERNPWFLCLVSGCDRASLQINPDGLHCPKCDFRRGWAWSWMADWSWRG